MRLIRRFFVTITAASIMFSAGHTASNAAADRYYTASKPGSANNTCVVLEYQYCKAGYYLENKMCIECPEPFTSTDNISELHKEGIEESCKIKLDPGYYYSKEDGRVPCDKGYYCPGDEQNYDENNQQAIGRFECPSGYYCPTTGLTETTYKDYKCPTGATSDAGSDEKTDCFLSKRTKFQDSKGTFSLPMADINIIATGN